MVYWTSFLGVLLIIFGQIEDRRSSNMCVQILEISNDSGGAITDRSFMNTRKNLIYPTDFSARNDRQQLCYERMMLMSMRAKVNKFRML